MMTTSSNSNSRSLKWGLGPTAVRTEQTHHKRRTTSPESMKPTRPDEEWQKLRHRAMLRSCLKSSTCLSAEKHFFSYIYLFVRFVQHFLLSLLLCCGQFQLWYSKCIFEMCILFFIIKGSQSWPVTNYSLCAVQHYYNSHTKWVNLHETTKLWFSTVETGLDFLQGGGGGVVLFLITWNLFFPELHAQMLPDALVLEN